ncbi:MAG: ABC-type uncharacterized transport system permease subunit [Planctomycetota bacterium]|jgi:ABC-type uncharacterized transport system permease subunit
MFPTLASALTTILYSLSAFLIFRQLGRAQHQRWLALLPAVLAVGLQALILAELILQDKGLNLGFFVAFSLINWLITIQILISCYFRRIDSLGIVVFPIGGLATIAATMHFTDELIVVTSAGIQTHILVSVIAYSLITLAAFQACLLAFQDRSIKQHHPGGFIRFLPPIHDMESLLFNFLIFGFIGLSASLATGFIYLQDIFAQHLVHKTVLSIFAWFVLAVLLFGRFKFGWRGKTAIRWTLSSFLLLMLSFFGSKLVLEFIL